LLKLFQPKLMVKRIYQINICITSKLIIYAYSFFINSEV
jgi:hypothetical protein